LHLAGVDVGGDDRHPAPSRDAVAGGKEVVQPLERVLCAMSAWVHHRHRGGISPRFSESEDQAEAEAGAGGDRMRNENHSQVTGTTHC